MEDLTRMWNAKPHEVKHAIEVLARIIECQYISPAEFSANPLVVEIRRTLEEHDHETRQRRKAARFTKASTGDSDIPDCSAVKQFDGLCSDSTGTAIGKHMPRKTHCCGRHMSRLLLVLVVLLGPTHAFPWIDVVSSQPALMGPLVPTSRPSRLFLPQNITGVAADGSGSSSTLESSYDMRYTHTQCAC